MKKIYLASLILSFLHVARAQDQLITYHGQFRTLMSDNRLSGNILKNDSLSGRRGAMGTLFLDFGIEVKPNEDFKLLAELRMRNVIGIDNQQSSNGVTLTTFNSLIDTRVIFRQVRAEGMIRKIVSYQVGDIDLSVTPYTLFNNYETFSMYESDIYKQRRTIAHYENFQNGTNWRLQGVTAKTQINLRGPVKKIDWMMFGTRTRLNNNDNIPDRMVTGGKLSVLQSNYFTVAGNWVGMFDVPGSALNDTLTDYSNHVLSASYKITPINNNRMELAIVGENGSSKNRYYIKSVDSTSNKNDYFLDAGLKFSLKKFRMTATASYINVGHNFTSPGAQTLRLRPEGSPMFFSSLHNLTSARSLNVMDRYSDEAVYNQRLHAGLMRFIPVYGNAMPYGAATPNRSGFVYNIGRALDTAYVVSWNFGGATLSELVSEGDSVGVNLRKFQQLQGGFSFQLSKILGFKKALVLSAGGRIENTKRSGSAYVDFSSTLLDAGLTAEVFKGFYLLGGYKSLSGEGTEVITLRDDFGTVSGYSPYLYKVAQQVVSVGLKMDLFKNSFAAVEYNRLSSVDKDFTDESYEIGNLFINFTMKF